MPQPDCEAVVLAMLTLARSRAIATKFHGSSDANQIPLC
jgi:hypothetical protein